MTDAKVELGGRPWPGGGRGDALFDLYASGVRPAADLPGVALRSLQRLRAGAGDNVPGRRGPGRSATFAGCSASHGEGYRKAELRVEGIRTSQERVRRLMREHDLQAPHRVGRAHGPKGT